MWSAPSAPPLGNLPTDGGHAAQVWPSHLQPDAWAHPTIMSNIFDIIFN